jgi:hypothetical protein
VNPRARHQGLIVEAVENEILIYDRRAHHAHHLNHTVAEVWRACDGTRSEAELALVVSRALSAPIESTCLRLALDQLRDADLLEENGEMERTNARTRRSVRPHSPSRRKVLRSLAIGIPLVTTILAPTIADAASCTGALPCTRFTRGQPCQDPSGQCGLCRGNGNCR